MLGKMLDTPSIPIVDLSSFFSDDSLQQRKQHAKDLTDACQSLGFAYITGHGVSSDLLQEAFAWSKKLYDLSHEDKMKAPHPPTPVPHRGYSAPGFEKVYFNTAQEADEGQGSKGESLKISDFKVGDLECQLLKHSPGDSL